MRYFLPVLITFLLCLTTLGLSAQELSIEERCVTDDKSRSVCIKDPVKRVISLSPGSTELIYAAGGGDKVIAVDAHSDYPSQVKNLPRIGGYPNISVEAITAMKPDVVIAWAGGNSPKVTSKLESIGIRVFYIDPITFPGIASTLRRLGTLFGTQAVAEENAADLDKRYQSLKLHYQSKRPVTVFYEIWNKPLMTISRDQIIGQVIELCGGRNIFADAAVRVPKVSMESLLGLNPEVILSSDGLKDGKSIQERWSRWTKLRAVREGSLFTVNGDQISRPTPRALDAAEITCQLLERVRSKSPQEASATPAKLHKEQ